MGVALGPTGPTGPAPGPTGPTCAPGPPAPMPTCPPGPLAPMPLCAPDQVGVVGMLEAATLLLCRDWRPWRMLYFAYGQDEEVGVELGAGGRG